MCLYSRNKVDRNEILYSGMSCTGSVVIIFRFIIHVKYEEIPNKMK